VFVRKGLSKCLFKGEHLTLCEQLFVRCVVIMFIVMLFKVFVVGVFLHNFIDICVCKKGFRYMCVLQMKVTIL
jgi:hypothetical protein